MAIIDGQGILSHASQLELSQQVSLAQVKSQGGRRSAQRRGPVLYNLTLEVGNTGVNSDKYYEVLEEIIALSYGEHTLRFKFNKGTSEARKVTSPRGNWSGTPIVRTAGLTGTGMEISGCQVNDASYAKTLDYVQFEGSTKVYQVSPILTGSSNSGNTATHVYAANGSGNLDFTLNSPLVNPPDQSSAVVFGNDVTFHMMLRGKPSVTYLPGDIVEFGSFQFEEVIADL